MADVFLSYRRSDIDRVRWMIDSLQRNNLSVWFDLELNAGTHFTLEIARQVETAKAMLVVWSEESVKSVFVLDEAGEGRDREILVPVAIDDVKLPYGFRQIQAASLVGAKGEEDSPEWQRVLTTLKLRCKEAKKTAPAPVAKPSSKLDAEDAKDAIREMIVVYLDQKRGKQTLAAVSQAVMRAYPRHCGKDNWFGHTRFRNFVASLEISGVSIDATAPGYLVLDPKAAISEPTDMSNATADPLIERIFKDTYAPRLTRRQFVLATDAIFAALTKADLLRPRADLTIANWNDVVSRARDDLRESTDTAIGLARLRAILMGMRYGGLGAGEAPESVDDLRLIYAYELSKQSLDAGRPLSEMEFDRLLEHLGAKAGTRPRF